MLQHVAIEVRRSEVEACLGFYELLGFVRVEPPASLAERAAWVESGGTQVHLLYADEPVVPAEGHFAVDLGGRFSDVVDALRAAGFEVEPRTQHWGVPRAVVRDPAGHRVELMAAAPGRSAAGGG